jgi:hypothetical protein
MSPQFVPPPTKCIILLYYMYYVGFWLLLRSFVHLIGRFKKLRKKADFAQYWQKSAFFRNFLNRPIDHICRPNLFPHPRIAAILTGVSSVLAFLPTRKLLQTNTTTTTTTTNYSTTTTYTTY